MAVIVVSPDALHSASTLLVEPPEHLPLLLRPALLIAEKITGKEAVPGRLLAHFPKGALGAGVFEAAAANASDMEQPDGARVLAVARIVASAVAGCPFCIDMNAATWQRVGLAPSELRSLLSDPATAVATLDARAAIAGKYAMVLSATPVVIDERLRLQLREQFSAHEIVVLATTIAQVNFWSRFSQGLGVPAAGFFDESACPVR
jgi:AhpD family alkylhydroperoxidase